MIADALQIIRQLLPAAEAWNKPREASIDLESFAAAAETAREFLKVASDEADTYEELLRALPPPLSLDEVSFLVQNNPSLSDDEPIDLLDLRTQIRVDEAKRTVERCKRSQLQ